MPDRQLGAITAVSNRSKASRPFEDLVGEREQLARPAPLISNPLAHLNLGVADHRAPFLEVEFDLFGELFRRAADRLIAEFCHALLDVGRPNDLDDLERANR